MNTNPPPPFNNILVGEDNVILQKVMEIWLSPLANKVMIAGNSQTLIQALTDEAYDLLLLDYYMDREASDLLGELLPLSQNKSIMVMVLTGEDIDVIKPKLREFKISALLKKPLKQDVLIQTINEQRKKSELPIDLTILENLNTKPERIRKILRLFIEEMPPAFKQMRKLLQEGDYHALKALVHKTKSGFGYLGLDSLYEQISLWEEQLKQGDHKNIEQNFYEVEHLTYQIIESLTKAGY